MSYVYNRILQTFENIFTNIYIPRINIYDIIEMLLIIFIFYFLAKAFKNTRTWVLLKGAMLLAVFYLIAYLFSFNVITKIFESAILVFAVGIVVIFSPEIKKFLERIGTKNFKKPMQLIFKKKNKEEYIITHNTIDEIVAACEQMSNEKTGALIVYENTIPLNEYIDTGIKIESIISRQLLLNIFENNTPLHDGAVIIKKNTIKAATCYLPLSEDKKISKRHGTRHRAALGISEATDALTIVVSEETGKISITKNGKIETVTPDALRSTLINFKNETSIQPTKKPLNFLRNNLALKITSVIFGIILWLTMINVSNPTISKTINSVPITIKNENAITSLEKTYEIEGNKYATIIITGHRSDVENIEREDIKVFADLSLLSEINTVRLVPEIENPDITLSVKEEILHLDIENCIEKKIKVSYSKKGKEDKSCYVYDITTPTPEITVKGPQSTVESISKIMCDIDVDKCKKDFEYIGTPILYDKENKIISKNNLTLSSSKITFKVHTYKTKEVDLSISVNCPSNLMEYINTISSIPTSILIASDEETLNNTETLYLSIPVSLTYDDVFEDTLVTKTNISKYSPENIFIPKDYQEIDIVLGFASEITKEITFDFSDIELQNKPSKFNLISTQKEFKVSIYGHKNDLSEVNLEDIKPHIDLSNIKEGKNALYIEYNTDEKFNIFGNTKVEIIAEIIVDTTE